MRRILKSAPSRRKSVRSKKKIKDIFFDPGVLKLTMRKIIGGVPRVTTVDFARLSGTEDFYIKAFEKVLSMRKYNQDKWLKALYLNTRRLLGRHPNGIPWNYPDKAVKILGKTIDKFDLSKKPSDLGFDFPYIIDRATFDANKVDILLFLYSNYPNERLNMKHPIFDDRGRFINTLTEFTNDHELDLQNRTLIRKP